MSRRLAAMSEESMESGGKSAHKAIIEESGLSEDLKRQLEERLANASFRSEHASAFAQVEMPAFSDKGTREIASATPWNGNEGVSDAALRMLSDAHKPLRTSPKVPGLRAPIKVDTGRSKTRPAAGTRIANARDKTSVYAFLKDPSLSETERQKYREELKARFQPASRATPATVQGLASLANERIEDAIARGQFKNLPRGKQIERDYNASSPFIDTTEYFMNKIIQKQDIVPPWIEKQQELLSLVNRFRGRLRADWKRHVARTISSTGGTLEQKLQFADECAFAESIANPPKGKVEQVNTVNGDGQLSQITLAGELKATPSSGNAALETEIKISEQTVNEDGRLSSLQALVNISAEIPTTSNEARQRRPTVPVFRDLEWEKTERSYLKAAVDNLNSVARAYNLMAPDLAKKPYFSLERELKSCYSDVAPQISDAIRERALAPRIQGVGVTSHTPRGVLNRFSMDRASQVYDERKPQYGFKEFWRDLFSPKSL